MPTFQYISIIFLVTIQPIIKLQYVPIASEKQKVESLPQYEIFNQNYLSNLFISPQLFEMNSSPRYLILSGERINIAPKYVCLLFLSYTHVFPFFLRIFRFASWQYKQQFVPCHIYLPTFLPSQPQVKVRKKRETFLWVVKNRKRLLLTCLYLELVVLVARRSDCFPF